jgi:hypothetical protein
VTASEAAPRHVAFVVPHPYVDALACFREPIQYLADEGWRVDLYTVLSSAHPVPFFGRGDVRIVPITVSRPGVVALVARLALHRPKYRCIVTVPQWGLHYSAVASRLAGVPMGCISDELKSGAEAVSAEARRWKDRERRAHQRCAWTIALSSERADFIRAENGLPPDHPVFVVPNAKPGGSRRMASHYFHDVLGLEPRQRVLLHAGSLWWSGTAALADAARSWPGDWVVVFQVRLADRTEACRDSAQVRFAPTVLPAALLDFAVSSASIGVALYDTAIANNRLMGTASGKVLLYMKNGLPVIATRAGGFEWLEREQCGVCVSGVDEIRAAADRIWADYDRFSCNVRRCYDESFEFGRRFAPVARLMATA